MAKEDWKTIDAQGLVNALGQDKGEQVWGLFQVSKEAYRAYMNERREFELAMKGQWAVKRHAKGITIIVGPFKRYEETCTWIDNHKTESVYQTLVVLYQPADYEA